MLSQSHPESIENQKMAVRLDDGLIVEAVAYGSGTLCVSSQAGCAIGCPFCASGARGLRRNLSAEEMQRQLKTAIARGASPQRITISGIGEPLHNWAEVERFMQWCSTEHYPVSLTTTGAPLNRLSTMLQVPHNGLMLSLHAGSASTHRQLIPKGPDYDALWHLLAEVLPQLSRRQRRRIGINYVVLAGINDSVQELELLTQKLIPFPDLTLHLLTCNPVPESTYTSPNDEAMDTIFSTLRSRGIRVRRANRWRRQSKGGCGTLYLRGLEEAGSTKTSV